MSNRETRKRSEVVSALGGAVEWYDYMLYAYLAPVFARVFIPSEDELYGILMTFGLFAAGYIVRPFGGLYWGHVGDRWGRKKTLVTSTTLMAIPMLLVALLPGFKVWGTWAPVTLFCLRLVQGFAVGGETTGVIVVLVESAPVGQRGRIGSYAQTVIGVGILFSSLLGALFSGILTEAQLDLWGWRVLYGIGALLAAGVTLLMQYQLQEPEEFVHKKIASQLEKSSILRVLKYYPMTVLKGTVLAGFAGVSFYIILAFFVTYMVTFLRIAHTTALLVTSLALAIWSFSAPIFGWISDQVGRKPVALWSSGLLGIMTIPMFLLAAQSSLWTLVIAQVLLVLPVAAYNTINAVQLGEMFPVTERYTGVSITYNFGQSFLGGTAPFFATLLAANLHIQLAPSFYLLIWCLITFLVSLTLHETAFKSLSELDQQLPMSSGRMSEAH